MASRRDPSADPSKPDRSNAAAGEWTCHYCGDRFAEPGQANAAHRLLVEHITSACPAVPESVRERYRRPCPGGSCRA